MRSAVYIYYIQCIICTKSTVYVYYTSMYMLHNKYVVYLQHFNVYVATDSASMSECHNIHCHDHLFSPCAKVSCEHYVNDMQTLCEHCVSVV